MKSDFGRYIDHTLLRPIGTTTDIRRLCTEAIEYGMAAVCIFPSYIPMAREILKDSRVKIATVIAFPFGQKGLMAGLGLEGSKIKPIKK